MKIEQYLRGHFSNYIRPLVIKNKCEGCGATEKIELHHVTQFAETLQETLAELEIAYKEDKEMYTSKELKIIKDMMLGKQIRQKYLTLCVKCHDEIETGRFIPISKLDNIRWVYQNTYDGDITYYKCFKPKKAIEYLEKQIKSGDMTEDECAYEYIEIEDMHPGFIEKLEEEQKVRIYEIINKVLK